MYYKGLVHSSFSLSKSQSCQSPNPMIDRADPRIPSSIGENQIPKFPNPPILQSHNRLVRSPDPDPPIPPIPRSPDPPIIDRPDPFEKMYYNEPEDLLEKGRALLKTGGPAAAAAAAAAVAALLSEIDEEDPPQPRKLNPRTARWFKGEDDTQLVWLSRNYLSSYTITHLTQLNHSPVQALHHIIKNQQAHALLAKELDLLASWLNPDPAAPPLDPRNDGNWKKMANLGRARGALTGFCLLIAPSMIFLV